MTGPRPYYGLPDLVRGFCGRPRGLEVRGTSTVILIGDRCADTIAVPLAGTNPRLRAHRVLDTDSSRFGEDLLPDASRKAKEFEYAVGLLFLFFGFGVDPLYSQRAMGDAPDVLAHEPGSPTILAIECTVGPAIGGEKLEKLIARSENIRRELRDNEVIAVLATGRPRKELSTTGVENAQRNDVALLAQEDLRDLWIEVQAGGTSAQVIHRLRRKLLRGKPRRARGPTA